MCVCGYIIGFWLDVLVVVDIVLWDLCGKYFGQLVCKLFGGGVCKVILVYIIYIFGLDEVVKLDVVVVLCDEGFRVFKVYVLLVFDLVVFIYVMWVCFLDIEIMFDFYWNYMVGEVVNIVCVIELCNIVFLEVFVYIEDIDGLVWLVVVMCILLVVGEEWCMVFDVYVWFKMGVVFVVQLEMGCMGIIQFMCICQLVDVYYVCVVFYVIIGFGIFMVVSLYVLVVVVMLSLYEVQNYFVYCYFDYFDMVMCCEGGCYVFFEGLGFGIELWDNLFIFVMQVG